MRHYVGRTAVKIDKQYLNQTKEYLRK
jgi:hypothetical protein